MRLVDDAKSFATEANAIRALDKALKTLGRSRDNVRWLVAVSSKGRFIPVVVPSGDSTLFTLIHLGIAIVG
jgi:hypothetical protein